MALQRARVTIELDVLRSPHLTADEVVRDLQRKAAGLHGPAGARSDDPHWFIALAAVTGSEPLSLHAA
jgi:hypothetical protein